ncbi:phage tail tape measure protein [Mycobacterium vulneris]|nr:phage tail tape measure protein [Mycolicibacterium vulneris]OCB66157.1 phage tail tape measure protein [Mycolicibacterium vulneris]
MADSQEVGRYVLPIIPSIEGIGPEIDRRLGKQFAGLSKQASQALSGGVRDGVAEAEAAIKKSSDNIAKLRDKEAGAADKLAAAEARVEEVREKGGSALKRAEAQRNAAHRAQLSALREIERETESLTDAQKRLANEQENAGRSSGTGFLAGLRGGMAGAGSAGSEAAASFAEGFAGSSALLRLGSAGGPIGLALSAAGLVGGGLLMKNVMAGIEREPGRDLVQAQLGLDAASMAQLAKSASKAYADNFGASPQDNLVTAKSAINNDLLAGADDPRTQHVIEQLTAVSQIIGEEIPSAAHAAGQMVKTGLVDNADQAFDLLVKGEQRGVNVANDLLDTFGEYPVEFQRLGLSGQETLGLLSQALKGGAQNSDKAADAIKEFAIRAVDGSKTTMQAYRDLGFSAKDMSERFAEGGPVAREAFRQILDAIGSIRDPLKQSQIAVSLFGTQAEDLGGAFNEMDLSNAVTQLGNVDGAAQDAADTMNDNVANSFEEARRSIEVSLDAVQDKLAEAFGPGMKQAADWVKQHEDDIADTFINLGIAAISVSQDVVKSTGNIVVAVGQLAGGIGNIQGAVTKFQAWQADIRGDHDQAEQLRAEAEEYFSWGEGIQKLGNDMIANSEKMDDWKQSLRDLRDQTGDAKDGTKGLRNELDGLPDRKDVVVNLTDAAGNPIHAGQSATLGIPALTAPAGAPSAGTRSSSTFNWDAVAQAESSGRWDDNNSGGHTTSSGAPRGGLQITDGTWKSFGGTEFAPTANLASKEQQIAVAERIAFTGYQGTKPQGLGAWEAITKGMVPGVTVNTPRGAAAPGPVAVPTGSVPSVQGTNPQISLLAQIAKDRFGLDLTSGKRDWAGTASGKSFHLTGEAGDFSNSSGNSPQQAEFAAWLNQNFGQYLQELIYSDPSVPGVSLNAGGPFDYGNKTMSEHQNHVHVAVKDGMAAAFEQALAGGGGVPTGINQSGPVSLVNAFGTGYKPGTGTPGYNELGEPGYYEVDPRQVAQAQRRAEDTQQAIADADQRILEAKQKRADLEDEINVTAEDRAAADREIANAEKAARRAREDAQWAIQDAEEARQGKFTAAKKAKQQGGKNGDLSEVGGIFGSFLKETFGFDGSLFPDLAELAPVKLAGGLLSAFKGPILGAAEGGLGIQQPGWTPGAPVQVPQSASGLPFGMVPSPFDFAGQQQPGAAPPGSPASGIGGGPAPGPIDQSRHVAVTVNGVDENKVADNVRRQIFNADRVMSYAPKGTG